MRPLRNFLGILPRPGKKSWAKRVSRLVKLSPWEKKLSPCAQKTVVMYLRRLAKKKEAKRIGPSFFSKSEGEKRLSLFRNDRFEEKEGNEQLAASSFSLSQIHPQADPELDKNNWAFVFVESRPSFFWAQHPSLLRRVPPCFTDKDRPLSISSRAGERNSSTQSDRRTHLNLPHERQEKLGRSFFASPPYPCRH